MTEETPAAVLQFDEMLDVNMGPGRYQFVVTKPTILHLELASGGGGGGGSADVHEQDGSGSRKTGAGKAGLYQFQKYTLDPDTYLLKVGGGGKGGTCLGRTHGATSGDHGFDSMLLAGSGLPIAFLLGGAGGIKDGNNNKDQGSPGDDVVDPVTQRAVGYGGAGGKWMEDGASAKGYGAGGGGSGGTRLPGRRGGDGAPGFARLALV